MTTYGISKSLCMAASANSFAEDKGAIYAVYELGIEIPSAAINNQISYPTSNISWFKIHREAYALEISVHRLSIPEIIHCHQTNPKVRSQEYRPE